MVGERTDVINERTGRRMDDGSKKTRNTKKRQLDSPGNLYYAK